MTRTDLLNRIAELATEAEASNELPTAGVLYVLMGALHARQEVQLMHVLSDFSREAILSMESKRN